jgi:hypothetical protein
MTITRVPFPHTYNEDGRCTWCDIRIHTVEAGRFPRNCDARQEEHAKYVRQPAEGEQGVDL